jgi:TRAP-type uncharacterized transport system fused permease subunit
VGALAAGISGWFIRQTSLFERLLLIGAGFILVYPAPAADAIGTVLVAAVAGWQWWTKRNTEKILKPMTV